MYAEAFISIDSSPSSGLCFSDILLVPREARWSSL